MRISPALLLFILLLFAFSPSITEWITENETAWYRPYFIWLAAIIIVYLGQRRHSQDEP